MEGYDTCDYDLDALGPDENDGMDLWFSCVVCKGMFKKPSRQKRHAKTVNLCPYCCSKWLRLVDLKSETKRRNEDGDEYGISRLPSEGDGTKRVPGKGEKGDGMEGKVAE
jgi:hypothetical protein